MVLTFKHVTKALRKRKGAAAEAQQLRSAFAIARRSLTSVATIGKLHVNASLTKFGQPSFSDVHKMMPQARYEERHLELSLKHRTTIAPVSHQQLGKIIALNGEPEAVSG